jgi:DNA-binding NarL/FixJ family response regulator
MDNRLLTTKGTSITRNILKIAPSTKFIFLSADTNAEEEVYASGASIFLTKPTSLKIVEEAVNIVLNNSNQYSYQNNRFRVKEP